jgi:poly(3-hydroxybutyrate) depolymerase
MKNFTYGNRKVLSIATCLLLFWSAAFSQQVPRGVTASNGVFIGFYEYTPTDYSANPNEKYPIIIFLHGIGERGNGTSELPLVAGQGIPRYIAAGHKMRFYWNGKWETFLVLSPQLSRNYGDWQNFYVDEMLKYARTNLRIDTNRIYLTGLSLGGGGVWRYASASLNNAKQFAAIAPVCGTCAVSSSANLANSNVPIWAFHALDDGVVGAGCTTSAIQGINSFNPVVKPLMSLYNNGGHFIWDRSYDTVYNWHNPNIYEWMLGQNKSLPVNIPPIANAGPNITVALPTTSVVLSAAASSDPDGNIAKYVWRKLSGPASGILQSPNNITTNITGLVLPGVYTYELMVVDNRAAYKYDTVTVTLNAGPPGTNIAPFAVAGADRTITVDNVALDSWGSNDVDGSITAYLWTKVAGPAQYNMPNNMYGSCGINGMVSGVYQFELRVTDNQGAYGRDTVQITVNLPGPPPPNQNPIANAGADINLTLPANSTTLNGSASSDPNGTITAYSWTRIGGPAQHTLANPSGATTGLSNLVQGTYSFRLVVTDNNGATDDDTVNVVVNPAPPPPNQAPNANAGADITITLPTNNTVLNGAASSDADGTINAYSWTYINGPAQYSIANNSASSTALTNLVQGTYSFRLVVTDNNGATDSDTVRVTVNAVAPPPNQAPVANAGADITLTLPANSTTLDASASTDADGSIASYSWSIVNGPAQFTIANPNGAATAFSNLVQGTYTLRLVVTDNNGATDDDTIVVTVNAGAPPVNLLPICKAGADISLTLPANSTSLVGWDSYDPDGWIASWSWSKVSGPASYTLGTPTDGTTTLTNLSQGTYTFELLVTDNSGGTDRDTVVVIVSNAPPPPNQLPVAIAGNDISITLPVNSANLNGTASNDPDGSLVSHNWVKISGPAQFNFADANAASTTVNNLVQGTYSFRLVVTDNNGATASDTISVVVNPAPNQAPTANAGANITITLPVNNTTLNGSASSDPDGTIASYNWNYISGPAQYTIANNSSVTTAVSNLVQGTYTFRLTVTDNDGASDSDTVTVTVNAAPPPPNQAPVANAGADITITLPTNGALLDGSASSDADGSISSYSWSKISGPAQFNIANGASASTNVNNLVQGTYSFRLVVTDNNGSTSSDTVNVVVNPAPPPPPNQLPVANAGFDATLVLPANSTTLNGASSIDPDGNLVAYSWTRISGPTQFTIASANSVSTALSNLVQGTYTFVLTVTDNSGATDTDTVIVTVNAAPPPPNQAPNAVAGNDISITLPTNTTTLNGSASNDPDGSIVSYNWSRLSGPAQGTIANANAATTALNGLVQGTYTCVLTVTDNNGVTDRDTVNVFVNPAPNQAPVANAGADFTVNLPAPTIALNGTLSFDPDGSIVNYDWVRISGPGAITIVNSTTTTPSVVGAQAGVYVFEIAVTDNNGAVSRDQVTVTVNAAANVPPVANAGNDTSITAPASSAQLDGSLSYDQDGSIVSYSWKQVAGPGAAAISNTSNAITLASGLLPGQYYFELTVTDNNGAARRDTVSILVYNNLRYEEGLTLYPNPTRNVLNIRCISDSVGQARMVIYDVYGAALRTTDFAKAQSVYEVQTTVTNLKAGVYYLEIIIEGRKRMIAKFIKQ